MPWVNLQDTIVDGFKDEPLPVDAGGTGAVDAAAARSNLGVDTAISDAIRGIEIGGRNLLLRSSRPVDMFSFSSSNGASTKAEETMLGTAGVTVNITTASTGWYYWVYSFGYSRMQLIKPSTQYTLSFDVYPSVDSSWSYRLLNANSTNLMTYNSNSVAAPADKWTHVVLTTTSVETITPSAQVVYLYGTNKAGTFKLCNFKLEEGNKATGWTPAPEDMSTIVSEGTSGNWHYTKYSSGIAICIGTYTLNLAADTAWYNLYYGTIPAISYPFVFTQKLYEDVGVVDGSQWVICGGGNLSTACMAYNICPYATSAKTMWIYRFVIGKWK